MRAQTSLKKTLQERGYQVTSDPEVIYWHEMFRRSLALRAGIDPRDRNRRKPVMLRRGAETIVVEYDYGRGGWLAWNDGGDIIAHERTKFDTLLKVCYGRAD